ncbi:MAG TPA: hypothetical protein VH595_17370 [Verrucomicrobiae bacterium]|jgi:hypothetical protein|nr:hypothetical protein [Verrucomicrobiae bacterium]
MNTPVIQSKKTKKKFDKTFKQHAVELWLNSGKAATAVAAELGFTPKGSVLGGSLRAAPNNWKSRTPVCGARMTICANNGIF